MDKVILRNCSKEERTRFLQSKYEYYKRFNICMVTVSTLAYLSFL